MENGWPTFLSAENQFKNVNVVSVDGGTGGPASYLANVFSNTVSWSPDGAYVLFDSGQRTESTQLARVDLVPRTPRFREDQFRDLFREEPPTKCDACESSGAASELKLPRLHRRSVSVASAPKRNVPRRNRFRLFSTTFAGA